MPAGILDIIDPERPIAGLLPRLGPGEPASAAERETIEAALAFSPGDARLYSLSGIAAEISGDAETAAERYGQALRLQPTEIQALLRTLRRDVANENALSAVAKTEMIAKRWPEFWDAIEPLLVAMLDSEAGFAAFAQSYRTSGTSRMRLVNTLGKSRPGADKAFRLLIEWRDRGIGDLDRESAAASAALLREGNPAAAHALFLHLLPEGKRDAVGYVFNGKFAHRPDNNPFDWRIASQTGVKVSLHTADDGIPPGETRAEIRFLGNPVRLSTLSQTVRLPAGEYILSTTYETAGLGTPRPIELVFECKQGARKLASIGFADGTQARRTDETVFTVPQSDCPIGGIRTMNAFVALSFQNRFEGKISIYDISIRRIGE